MKTTAKIAAVLLVLALVGSVSARVITVEVTGVVDGVGTHGGLALDGSVDTGSAMTGFTTYDTDTPDLSDGSNGRYALISISMTVGNYTFTHDPMSSTSALFEVRILSSNSYSYTVRSHDPRFDGTVYIDGSPKTFDEVNLDPFGLHLMKLVDPDSIITDELPDLDSWPDISTFTSERYFGVGVDSPPDEPGFAIWGEVTSLTVVPEPPKTYYVNAAEGNDNNDGLSPQTAFATIQKAIDSAFDGDTVLVADGTYTGHGNRDIDFLGKAITVRSESGPENCIIDCNGTEEELHRGFYFHSGEGPDSVLDGFTITNGCAYKGGAIYCRYSSSPTITNCIIRGNVSPAAPGFPWYFLQDGGGIYCSASSPIIENCHLLDNTATAGGGAIYSWHGNALVRNSVITGNRAGISGGGVGLSEDNMSIRNCVITGNSSAYVFYGGGGIYCSRSTPTIVSCTISGNWADGYGGGMYVRGSNATLTNSILWRNNASEGPEIGLRAGPFGPALLDVSYNDIEGGQEAIYVYGDSTLIWGLGNINADPCFVEPGYWADANDPNIVVEPNDPNAVWIDGDYYLLPDSLCIDAGDPNYVPEPDETDIDGNPRVINGRIDMGAYETNYIQAAMKFTPQMLNCNSKGKYIKAHLTLPEGFLPQDVDVNESAIAEPIGIESEYIKVLGSHKGQVRLEICFDREAFCAQITETGEVEITVIGSLTTSRYFYATDTIKIKP